MSVPDKLGSSAGEQLHAALNEPRGPPPPPEDPDGYIMRMCEPQRPAKTKTSAWRRIRLLRHLLCVGQISTGAHQLRSRHSSTAGEAGLPPPKRASGSSESPTLRHHGMEWHAARPGVSTTQQQQQPGCASRERSSGDGGNAAYGPSSTLSAPHMGRTGSSLIPTSALPYMSALSEDIAHANAATSSSMLLPGVLLGPASNNNSSALLHRMPASAAAIGSAVPLPTAPTECLTAAAAATPAATTTSAAGTTATNPTASSTATLDQRTISHTAGTDTGLYLLEPSVAVPVSASAPHVAAVGHVADSTAGGSGTAGESMEEPLVSALSRLLHGAGSNLALPMITEEAWGGGGGGGSKGGSGRGGGNGGGFVTPPSNATADKSLEPSFSQLLREASEHTAGDGEGSSNLTSRMLDSLASGAAASGGGGGGEGAAGTGSGGLEADDGGSSTPLASTVAAGLSGGSGARWPPHRNLTTSTTRGSSSGLTGWAPSRQLSFVRASRTQSSSLQLNPAVCGSTVSDGMSATTAPPLCTPGIAREPSIDLMAGTSSMITTAAASGDAAATVHNSNSMRRYCMATAQLLQPDTSAAALAPSFSAPLERLATGFSSDLAIWADTAPALCTLVPTTTTFPKAAASSSATRTSQASMFRDPLEPMQPRLDVAQLGGSATMAIAQHNSAASGAVGSAAAGGGGGETGDVEGEGQRASFIPRPRNQLMLLPSSSSLEAEGVAPGANRLLRRWRRAARVCPGSSCTPLVAALLLARPSPYAGVATALPHPYNERPATRGAAQPIIDFSAMAPSGTTASGTAAAVAATNEPKSAMTDVIGPHSAPPEVSGGIPALVTLPVEALLPEAATPSSTSQTPTRDEDSNVAAHDAHALPSYSCGKCEPALDSTGGASQHRGSGQTAAVGVGGGGGDSTVPAPQAEVASASLKSAGEANDWVADLAASGSTCDVVVDQATRVLPMGPSNNINSSSSMWEEEEEDEEEGALGGGHDSSELYVRTTYHSGTAALSGAGSFHTAGGGLGTGCESAAVAVSCGVVGAHVDDPFPMNLSMDLEEEPDLDTEMMVDSRGLDQGAVGSTEWFMVSRAGGEVAAAMAAADNAHNTLTAHASPTPSSVSTAAATDSTGILPELLPCQQPYLMTGVSGGGGGSFSARSVGRMEADGGGSFSGRWDVSGANSSRLLFRLTGRVVPSGPSSMGQLLSGTPPGPLSERVSAPHSGTLPVMGTSRELLRMARARLVQRATAQQLSGRGGGSSSSQRRSDDCSAAGGISGGGVGSNSGGGGSSGGAAAAALLATTSTCSEEGVGLRRLSGRIAPTPYSIMASSGKGGSMHGVVAYSSSGGGGCGGGMSGLQQDVTTRSQPSSRTRLSLDSRVNTTTTATTTFSPAPAAYTAPSWHPAPQPSSPFSAPAHSPTTQHWQQLPLQAPFQQAAAVAVGCDNEGGSGGHDGGSAVEQAEAGGGARRDSGGQLLALENLGSGVLVMGGGDHSLSQSTSPDAAQSGSQPGNALATAAAGDAVRGGGGGGGTCGPQGQAMSLPGVKASRLGALVGALNLVAQRTGMRDHDQEQQHRLILQQQQQHRLLQQQAGLQEAAAGKEGAAVSSELLSRHMFARLEGRVAPSVASCSPPSSTITLRAASPALGPWRAVDPTTSAGSWRIDPTTAPVPWRPVHGTAAAAAVTAQQAAATEAVRDRNGDETADANAPLAPSPRVSLRKANVHGGDSNAGAMPQPLQLLPSTGVAAAAVDASGGAGVYAAGMAPLVTRSWEALYYTAPVTLSMDGTTSGTNVVNTNGSGGGTPMAACGGGGGGSVQLASRADPDAPIWEPCLLAGASLGSRPAVLRAQTQPIDSFWSSYREGLMDETGDHISAARVLWGLQVPVGVSGGGANAQRRPVHAGSRVAPRAPSPAPPLSPRSSSFRLSRLQGRVLPSLPASGQLPAGLLTGGGASGDHHHLDGGGGDGSRSFRQLDEDALQQLLVTSVPLGESLVCGA